MNRLLVCVLFAVAALLGGAGCGMTPTTPASVESTPVAVVELFYAMHQPDASKGLPDASAMPRYRGFLSAKLLDRLERARAVQRAAIAAHPDEKPPYIEGALFVSLFEGYTSAHAQTVAMEGARASVPVKFEYVDGSGRSEWVDFVALVREDGEWRIDDVRYGGDWDFANRGTLSAALDTGE